LKRRTTLAPSYVSTIVGPGVIAGSFPPRLKPQMVCSGIFRSDVMRKRVFSLARLMKKSSGGKRLKNWKQSVPGRRVLQKDHMPGLFATQRIVAAQHFLQHITVTHRRAAKLNTLSRQDPL